MLWVVVVFGLFRNECVILGVEDVDIEVEIWDVRVFLKIFWGIENDWFIRGRWFKFMCLVVYVKFCLGFENKGVYLLDFFISMIWGLSE